MASSHEHLNPQVIARLCKELRKLSRSPPEGVKYIPNDDDKLGEVHAEITGPTGTPFAGGAWRLKLVLGQDFPNSPPKGFFLTRIFHPNIAKNGDICVNTLKRDWKPTMGISHVLQVIRCLLIVPFPESSLNDEAGKMFMESYEDYAQRARLMTRIHALKPGSPAKEAPSADGETEEAAASGADPQNNAASEAAAGAAAAGGAAKAAGSSAAPAVKKQKVKGKTKKKKKKSKDRL